MLMVLASAPAGIPYCDKSIVASNFNVTWKTVCVGVDEPVVLAQMGVNTHPERGSQVPCMQGSSRAQETLTYEHPLAVQVSIVHMLLSSHELVVQTAVPVVEAAEPEEAPPDVIPLPEVAGLGVEEEVEPP